MKIGGNEVTENNTWYRGWECYEEYKHPVLEKHRPILETLMNERVFAVWKTENGFCITECCDEYFCHVLNTDDCLELSALFKDLAEELEK